jgi:hypothetical protein
MHAVSIGGSSSSMTNSYLGSAPVSPSSLRFRPAAPADVEAGVVSNIMVKIGLNLCVFL